MQPVFPGSSTGGLASIASFLEAVVLGPLASFLLGVVAVKSVSAWRKRRNLLFRILPLRVWRFDFRSYRLVREKITVAYGIIPPSAVHLPYYMVEEGDVSALYDIVSLVSSLYGRGNVEVQNHYDAQSELHKTPNLLTMSGPVWNSVTEMYLGLSGSPVVFELNENKDLRLRITRGDEIELIESEYTDDHRPKKCHGVVMASNVSIGVRRQQVLLLAGSSNLSTYGSALMLSAIHQDKALQATIRPYRLWGEDCWMIVFRIENWAEGGNWHSDIPPIKTGVLRLSVVEVFRKKDFLEPFEYHLGSG